MFQATSELSSPPAPPARKKPARPGGGDHRWQLRLVISVPALLILVTLIHGLCSYYSFSRNWDELDRLGAGQIAGDLLRDHLTTMIVLAVVAGGVGVALSYTILRPIRALVEATRLVALGRLDLRAPQLPAAREINDLSHSFNLMIENLNRSIAQRNRCLMEGIPIGVITTDLEGRVGAISPAAAAILGLEAERILGRGIAELHDIQPGSSQVLVEYLSSLIAGEPAQPATQITLGGVGGERTLTVTSSLLRDSNGLAFGIMFSFREASQIHDLSDELSRTDQLAALGTFTLGLAHELRNPLGAIKGLSQLLLLERGLPERAGDFLKRMTHEVDRVDAFVRQLFDLSEQPVACLTPTILADVVQKALNLARHEVSVERVNTVGLSCELEKTPPLMLEADRLILGLAKIIQNAYEATPAGGSIRLRLFQGPREGGPAYAIVIANSGSSIAPELRRKIFEPFFTTKERATGLGLTIANQIIVQNGGAVGVEADEDEVRFRVSFSRVRLATAGASGHAEGGGP